MANVNVKYDPAFYAEQGYFHLRPDNPGFHVDVEEAARTFHDLLNGPSSGSVRTAFKNKDGKMRHLLFVDRHSEVYRRLMLSEEVRSLVAKVFGPERVYVTHSKISHKEAGQDLPWYPHQDNGYKLVNGVPLRKGMTVGIFLEDSNEENGTLQVFAGSQKLKTLPHRFQKENDDDWSGQIVIESIPDGYDPTPIIAGKGDILIFNLDTIHQSQPNLSHGYRPLLLFEVERYAGPVSDENGNPPIIINGKMNRRERVLCSLHGIPKKIKLTAGRFPAVKTLYRRLRFG